MVEGVHRELTLETAVCRVWFEETVEWKELG